MRVPKDKEKEAKDFGPIITVQKGMNDEQQEEADALLFRTPGKVAYIAFKLETGVEVLPIRSFETELILGKKFFDKNGMYPPHSYIKELLRQLEWEALVCGYEAEVHIRYAEHDGKVYVNLCNGKGEAVEIAGDDWEVKKLGLQEPFFISPSGALPLPYPEKGGDVRDLADFINVGGEEAFILIVAYVLGCMNPNGPFPILQCYGPQGSGKTTLMKLLGELIDPAKAAVTTFPFHTKDIFVNALHAWLLRYDNISVLKRWQSDDLCRISTEGSIRHRQRYTDTQEVIITAMRPVMLNGIDVFSTANDLQDRSITHTCPPIKAESRRTEMDIKAKWSSEKPKILGSFYSIISTALRNFHHTKLEKPSRMADFVHWIVSAEPACFWDKGQFQAAYDRNRMEMIDDAIEADPLGEAILKLMKGHSSWQGTSTELFRTLKENVLKETSRLKDWPKAPAVLSNRLMRLVGFLSNKGIEIERQRSAEKRLIILTKSEEPAQPKPTAQTDPGPAPRPAEGSPEEPEPTDGGVDEEREACFFGGGPGWKDRAEKTEKAPTTAATGIISGTV